MALVRPRIGLQSPMASIGTRVAPALLPTIAMISMG
jgi:hypothetical protein